jgi:hypothetical protein
MGGSQQRADDSLARAADDVEGSGFSHFNRSAAPGRVGRWPAEEYRQSLHARHQRRDERRAAHRTLHEFDPKTYDGDQWVRVEVLAHGDDNIKHIVEGQTVLEYSKPQIGGGQASPTDPKVKVDGTPLPGGYISLQAETAPIDFRKVELLNLQGCMDPKASNFKSYFVKGDASKCRY